ncbi:MAG: phosphotransferase [Myxococcota bacterium]|nr:phosphotransferase [Myxococcota bacterium]
MDRSSPALSCPPAVLELVESALGRRVIASEAIPPGLDVRLFYRIRLEGDGSPSSLVARVDPRANPASDLEPIRALFAAGGVPVPARYGDAPGIELLEDLGSESLEALAHRASPERLESLYAEACSLVPRIQSIAPPSPDGWDAALVASKAQKWIDWVLPLALGRPAGDDECALVKSTFAFIAEIGLAGPRRLAHRDFKAANLLWAPAASEETRQLTLIDLQGAFAAPPEYDLVCLLRDSQVPLAEAAIESQLRRIRPELPDRPSDDEFHRRFDLITVSRVAKDIAHYLHAASARGDRRYLPFVSTGLAHLQGASQRAAERDRELAPWAELVAELPRPIPAPGNRRDPEAP